MLIYFKLWKDQCIGHSSKMWVLFGFTYVHIAYHFIQKWMNYGIYYEINLWCGLHWHSLSLGCTMGRTCVAKFYFKFMVPIWTSFYCLFNSCMSQPLFLFMMDAWRNQVVTILICHLGASTIIPLMYVGYSLCIWYVVNLSI